MSPNGSGRPADDRVSVGGAAEGRGRAVLPLVGGQEPQTGDLIRQGLPVNIQEEPLSSRTMWSLRAGHDELPFGFSVSFNILIIINKLIIIYYYHCHSKTLWMTSYHTFDLV